MWIFICFLSAFVLFTVFPLLYTFITKDEVKKGPIISRFVSRWLLDRIEKVPKSLYGFALFCGKQGGGKTYSCVRYIIENAKKYGCDVLTNTPLFLGDDISCIPYKTVDDLVYLIEDDRKYIILIDEIQTLFDSRDFNKDFYSVFCQLRKRNIRIVATSQVFERVALQLREQCSELYFCSTWFGCLTWCRSVAPLLNTSGRLGERVHLGSKCYVQTAAVRSAYDTIFRI